MAYLIFFRTSNHVPLFPDDYLDRFYRSAASLRLTPLHTAEELKHIVAEMIRRNDVAESGLKMILTGGYSPDWL
jgi:D-alanine transaminase/branched-chain amino acid aminotransferase